MKEFRYSPPSILTDTGNSIGKILSWIEPGSLVLECGCASGYTTKYLSEHLDCKVYIVEIDRDSYEQAMNYAVDGVCGDLMQDEWSRAFRGMRFDYVLFVDVLEHVYDPAFALTRATALLKDDGEVMVSLPNVTNNDILARMHAGRFDYSKTGLLDETHIRFFGPRNLEGFFAKSDLGIARMDYTVSKLFGSEQFADSNEVDEPLAHALSLNPWGSVYQFVMALRKRPSMAPEDYAAIAPPEEPVTVPANLFYAEPGGVFTNGSRMSLGFAMGEPLEASIDLAGRDVAKVRLDPVERMPCLVSEAHVLADGKELEAAGHNGIRCPAGYVFETKDPQISYDVPAGTSRLEIRAHVVPALGSGGVSLLRALRDSERDHIAAQAASKEARRAAEASAAEGMAQLSKLLAQSEEEARRARKSLDSCNRDKRALEKRIASQRRETDSLWWTFKHFWLLLLRKLHLRK